MRWILYLPCRRLCLEIKAREWTGRHRIWKFQFVFFWLIFFLSLSKELKEGLLEHFFLSEKRVVLSTYLFINTNEKEHLVELKEIFLSVFWAVCNTYLFPRVLWCVNEILFGKIFRRQYSRNHIKAIPVILSCVKVAESNALDIFPHLLIQLLANLMPFYIVNWYYWSSIYQTTLELFLNVVSYKFSK